MPLPADPQLLLTQAREGVIAALPDIVAIYALGSAVTGHFSAGSDLDLAVLGQRPYDAQRLYDVARSLEVRLDVDVDLIDLLGASTLLKHQVFAHGRRLHCSDAGQALDFEARSLTEYGEYRERIGPLLESVRETGRAYPRG